MERLSCALLFFFFSFVLSVFASLYDAGEIGWRRKGLACAEYRRKEVPKKKKASLFFIGLLQRVACHWMLLYQWSAPWHGSAEVAFACRSMADSTFATLGSFIIMSFSLSSFLFACGCFFFFVQTKNPWRVFFFVFSCEVNSVFFFLSLYVF